MLFYLFLFFRNEQATDNGRALQWTNGLGSSNAFITLVSGPTPNSTSGTESGTVSTNVWHSNDAGDVNFTDQSNTQQLLASTEKVIPLMFSVIFV